MTIDYKLQKEELQEFFNDNAKRLQKEQLKYYQRFPQNKPKQYDGKTEIRFGYYNPEGMLPEARRAAMVNMATQVIKSTLEAKSYEILKAEPYGPNDELICFEALAKF